MLVYQRVGNEQMSNKVGVEHVPDIVSTCINIFCMCKNMMTLAKLVNDINVVNDYRLQCRKKRVALVSGAP